ncbi:MAG: GNAT family N-acetyltransferase [Candidatus Cloacimonetes bacterium]|jgi:RimJ/RimL family protein N-acetyltransferase|nr:GNAT family N-acetyltransferase [Candidatus Cloacimonadota bacterium]MDY0173377.1 GNAT family protein [Candidatus Cloacimonadaceae bacterium]
MKYFRKLVGEKCYLSPISLDDVERYTEWVNDLEIGQFVLFSAEVLDVSKERAALQDLMTNSVSFAIIEKDTNKVIGNCSLHNINEVHRHAQFGIFIGEKTFWNQGIGTEATTLILDFGFNILNLNNINLEVADYNKRAAASYVKTGFQYVGKRSKYAFMAGEYHDVLIYEMLAENFESPYVKKTFEYAISDEAGRNKISII